MRPLTTFIILVFLTSCNQSDRQADTLLPTSYETPEQLKSIYGQWTIQQIIDSIFKDTLFHRNYFDTLQADTFYLRHIYLLTEKIKADGNDSTKLFPETPFDKVTASDALVTWEKRNLKTIYKLSKTLSKEQTDRLLQIINNPLNFEWGECGTWTPSAKFEFYYNDNLVKTLTVGCSFQFRSDYQKIKFGSLTDKQSQIFGQLCTDIGLKNE